MIDPASVPTFLLASGAKIPAIGIGTFGSDRYSPLDVSQSVASALRFGYRHVDCASVYGNEAEIGSVLANSGIEREELWITSKLWNDRHGDAIRACEESLARLRLEYLDLYLVHWPVPNFHAPKVDVGSRDPNARPFILDEFMKTWRQMEELVRRGLVRHIGTSNVTISKLRGVLSQAEVRPAVNEMELHPHFQQPELFGFVRSEGILAIGYCPLGSPSRPERDRTADDTVDLEDPVVVGIAQEQNLTPAQVCIRWAIQRGQVPIPFSVKPHQYESSLAAAVASPLSDAEMAALAGIDRGCRLIKGQVFLWPGAKDWTALWEE